MRRIDISMPLFEGMPAFPGDPAFENRPSHSIDRGDAYNVSSLAMGTHAGTHVDPPRHFLPEGLSVDEIDLDALNGPCHVVELPHECKVIRAAEVASVPPKTERVLFRTSNSARWAERLEFFPDYVGLDVTAADELVARGGVRLVGIDSLSVESDPSGRFPVHHALLGDGILILEGLLLADARAGPYELHCLPLRVRHGDGGPARAVVTPRPRPTRARTPRR
jgi:arylformamidase